MDTYKKLPDGVLFIIALLCNDLEGWQLVRGTRYETAYIRRRLPSWEILTKTPYPIIWIREAIKAKAPVNANAIACSAQNGYMETVKALLEAKAPVDLNVFAFLLENTVKSLLI